MEEQTLTTSKESKLTGPGRRDSALIGGFIWAFSTFVVHVASRWAFDHTFEPIEALSKGLFIGTLMYACYRFWPQCFTRSISGAESAGEAVGAKREYARRRQT